jgi:hypothetical protein
VGGGYRDSGDGRLNDVETVLLGARWEDAGAAFNDVLDGLDGLDGLEQRLANRQECSGVAVTLGVSKKVAAVAGLPSYSSLRCLGVKSDRWLVHCWVRDPGPCIPQGGRTFKR